RKKSLVIDRILNTPSDFRKGLLDGFLNGDGHHETDADRYTVGIASSNLVKDLQLLTHSLGYYSTIGSGKVYLKSTLKGFHLFQEGLCDGTKRPEGACQDLGFASHRSDCNGMRCRHFHRGAFTTFEPF